MIDEREVDMDYPPLDADGNVTDGSVDSYDFDWGDEIVRREEQLPPKAGEWPYFCCFERPDFWPRAESELRLCQEPLEKPELCPPAYDRKNDCECKDTQESDTTQSSGEQVYEIQNI